MPIPVDVRSVQSVPFNVHDVLSDCLAALEKGKRLSPRQRLIVDLLPPLLTRPFAR